MNVIKEMPRCETLFDFPSTHSSSDLFLKPPVGWPVKNPVLDTFGQVFLFYPAPRIIVGIAVIFPIAQLFHQIGRRIPDV